MKLISAAGFLSFVVFVLAEPAPPTHTATLKSTELRDFTKAPAPVQSLLGKALELTSKNLSYLPGSADPAKGGTDCSGFVYYLLQQAGMKEAPRQSNEMYAWAWKAGLFRATNGVTMDTFEWAELKPGDLVFWVNSTAAGRTDRDPPVTHVMFYLGVRASDGKKLLAGASEGRTYDGKSMAGVSVLDFKLPNAGSPARCIGYAQVPGLLTKPAPSPGSGK